MKTIPKKNLSLGALPAKILRAGLPAVALVMAYILYYTSSLSPASATVELPRVSLMLEHALMSFAILLGGSLAAQLAEKKANG